MEKFSYVNAKSVNQVPVLLDDSWENTKVIAGGTDLVGEMKDYIETPKKLVNLKTIPDLDKIEVKASGVTIGALVTLSELVGHPEIQENYGVLAQAGAHQDSAGGGDELRGGSLSSFCLRRGCSALRLAPSGAFPARDLLDLLL